jgi:hypothetical protein
MMPGARHNVEERTAYAVVRNSTQPFEMEEIQCRM